MSLKNNTLLQGGKYKIIRFINSGGFGCTYEAEHTLFKTHVAIKEFFKEDLCNRDERTNKVSVGVRSKAETVAKLKKKFLEEATSVFQMKHPGIVRVIDIFEENGTAYYVMDFIDGCSLSDLVKRRGKLPEKEALHYILQVIDALQYVHSRNRLHLDIKPGNIMVDKQDRAILIDFGASKHYNEDSGKQDSTLLGVNTPGYTPVEQVAKKFSKFNPATDIYALGATLYKLLTGITPMESILRADEDDENEIFDDLPPALSASTRKALMAAMQIKSINRPQSITEFKKMLDADITDDENTHFDNYDDSDDTNDSTILDENLGKKKKNGAKTLNMVKIICGLIPLLIVGFIALYALGTMIMENGNNTTKITESKIVSKQEPSRISEKNSKPQEREIYFNDYSSLKIGDYMYADGSFAHKLYQGKQAIGLIFSLKTSPTEKKQGFCKGVIVALKDAGSGSWGEEDLDLGYPHDNIVKGLYSEKIISTVKKDLDGYKYSKSSKVNKFEAFKIAKSYKVQIPVKSTGWYLPSVGQMAAILENINGFTFNTHPDGYTDILLNKGPNFKSNPLNFDLDAYEYWTSSERSKYYAWVYQPHAFGTGTLESGRKGMDGKIRAVAAF